MDRRQFMQASGVAALGYPGQLVEIEAVGLTSE